MSSQRDFETLREIEHQYGGLTATAVVEACRDLDHPWHDRFEWDDSAAGVKYREQQARMLIRSVRYERHTETTILRSVAYVRDPDADAKTQSYCSVISLRTDQDRAREVMLAEFGRVVSAMRRAREIAAVLGFEDQVAGMLADAEQMTAILLRPSVGAAA